MELPYQHAPPCLMGAPCWVNNVCKHAARVHNTRRACSEAARVDRDRLLCTPLSTEQGNDSSTHVFVSPPSFDGYSG